MLGIGIQEMLNSFYLRFIDFEATVVPLAALCSFFTEQKMG